MSSARHCKPSTEADFSSSPSLRRPSSQSLSSASATQCLPWPDSPINILRVWPGNELPLPYRRQQPLAPRYGQRRGSGKRGWLERPKGVTHGLRARSNRLPTGPGVRPGAICARASQRLVATDEEPCQAEAAALEPFPARTRLSEWKALEPFKAEAVPDELPSARALAVELLTASAPACDRSMAEAWALE